MARSYLITGLVVGFAAITMASTHAAERPSDDDPQWPNVATQNLPNPNPSFVNADAVVARILQKKTGDRDLDAGLGDTAITGSTARWPELPPDAPPPSPFAFETGARYWFSGGKVHFAFRNGSPDFGDPTSTLDWHGLTAHAGEAFARLDHIPSGFFVKGLAGIGTITQGQIDDRDFFAGQIKFSDTTSDVGNSSNLSYAMVDVGWGYSPTPGVRFGAFVGYHFWQEKMTAFGLVCNPISPLVIGGCPLGAVEAGSDTQVFTYQPTWQAFRAGIEGRFAFGDGWSFNAEIAGVPYASVNNKDSHLLRQDLSDLGPAPNVITQSTYAYGLETEATFNYQIMPNVEVGAGVRYWGLVARYGGVRAGPTFTVKNTVTDFNEQRYGMIAQIKAKF